MKRFLSFFSILFHPIVIPLLTGLLYFKLNSNYFDRLETSIILVQISIMTMLIPIAIYYFLRSIKLVDSSIMLSSKKERIIPFGINILLLFILQEYVLYNSSAYALMLFFKGLTISYILLLLAVLLNQKYSVHAALLVACTTFYTFMMVNTQNPDIITLIVLIILTGITMSSRLFLRAHTSTEIIIGSIIGFVPQLSLHLYLSNWFV